MMTALCMTRPLYTAVLALAVLTSCAWYGRLDPDEDGVQIGEDCDDTNPEIGAVTPWFVDADDDGFGGGDLQVGCAPAVHIAQRGGDCDDTNAAVKPDAAEICDDGVVNDCPPATVGEAALECGLSRTYTISEAAQGRQGAVYVGDAGSGVGGTMAYALNGFAVPRGDGVALLGTSGEREAPFGEPVGGWDGAAGEAPSVLYGVWVGRERWLVVGSPSASNGDDVVGAAYIISEGGEGSLRGAAVGATLLGALAGDELGAAVVGGDVNGDGLTDLLVGAPGADDSAGCVALILGGEDEFGDPVLAVPTGETLDGHRLFCGSAAGERAGASLAVADLNGDGVVDLAVGAPGQDDGDGAVYGIVGSDSRGVLSRYSSKVITLEGSGAFGFTLASNGAGDLLIGAPDYQSGAGQVTLVASEPDWGVVALGQAPVVTGKEQGDRLGSAMAGGVDLDGDGVADPVLGAPGWDTDTLDDVGALFVLNGASFTPGSREVGVVEHAGGFVVAAVLGEDAGAQLGTSVLLVRELDAIPGAELVVGARGPMSQTEGGAVWLIPGADL